MNMEEKLRQQATALVEKNPVIQLNARMSVTPMTADLLEEDRKHYFGDGLRNGLLVGLRARRNESGLRKDVGDIADEIYTIVREDQNRRSDDKGKVLEGWANALVIALDIHPATIAKADESGLREAVESSLRESEKGGSNLGHLRNQLRDALTSHPAKESPKSGQCMYCNGEAPLVHGSDTVAAHAWPCPDPKTDESGLREAVVEILSSESANDEMLNDIENAVRRFPPSPKRSVKAQLRRKERTSPEPLQGGAAETLEVWLENELGVDAGHQNSTVIDSLTEALDLHKAAVEEMEATDGEPTPVLDALHSKHYVDRKEFDEVYSAFGRVLDFLEIALGDDLEGVVNAAISDIRDLRDSVPLATPITQSPCTRCHDADGKPLPVLDARVEAGLLGLSFDRIPTLKAVALNLDSCLEENNLRLVQRTSWVAEPIPKEEPAQPEASA